MASPFNIFRKNQRIMMAALVAMSMFAFVFMDPSIMRGGGLPKPLIVLLTAGVCGIGMWFVGQRHGKSSEWGSIAALLGAVAAFFYVRTPDEQAAVRTTFGAVTDQELSALRRKRMQANQFVMMASQKTKASRPSQGFGPTDDRSMLQFKLGQKEAQRLGVALNADAVNRYISEITDDKLSQQSFSEILKELQLSQGELFKILQGELEVRLAMSLQVPPYDSWLDFHPQNFQMFPRFKLPATPDEAWENFEKLNVKQSLAAVALPVDAFVKTLEDPSEEELKKFFEERKKFRPGRQGEPGFVQPQRVRLAYLAAEFEKFESQAKPPTDDDVTKFYEENIERYRIREIPNLPSDDDPADASTPENIAPEIPEPTPPEEKSDAKPEEKPPEEKKEESPSEEKKPDGEKSSAVTTSPKIRLAAFVQETEAEKPEAAASEGSEFPDDKPVSADGAIPAATVEDPLLMPPKPGDKQPEKPRYRPLDDDLRDRIREEILNNRTFEKMGEAMDAARIFMERQADGYLTTEDKDKSAKVKSIAEGMNTYATEHGLTYVETPLVSETELMTEDIGSAVLPAPGGMQFQARSVFDDVFPRNGQTSPLFFPQRADSRLRDKRYSWWKVEDKPQHEPEWTDDGIPEQVKAGWKYDQGRKLAELRAKELVELAAGEGTDLAKAFAGQTVTGKEGSESVVVKQIPRFSWLSTSSSVPFGNDLEGFFATPRMSFVDGVDQPSEEFMKTVFADLKPGQTGMVPNFPRTAFYVVQPQQRDGGETAPEDLEGYLTISDLRERFLNLLSSERRELAARPYNLLMSEEFARLQQRWAKSFDDRYGVEMDDPEGTPAGSQQ